MRLGEGQAVRRRLRYRLPGAGRAGRLAFRPVPHVGQAQEHPRAVRSGGHLGHERFQLRAGACGVPRLEQVLGQVEGAADAVAVPACWGELAGKLGQPGGALWRGRRPRRGRGRVQDLRDTRVRPLSPEP